MASAAVGHATVELGASTSYLFGAEAGRTAAFAGAIVATIALTYLSIASTPTAAAAASTTTAAAATVPEQIGMVTTVTSAALQIGSMSAAYAGKESLAKTLANVSLGATIIGGVASYEYQKSTKLDYTKLDYLSRCMNVSEQLDGARGGLDMAMTFEEQMSSLSDRQYQIGNLFQRKLASMNSFAIKAFNKASNSWSWQTGFSSEKNGFGFIFPRQDNFNVWLNVSRPER